MPRLPNRRPVFSLWIQTTISLLPYPERPPRECFPSLITLDRHVDLDNLVISFASLGVPARHQGR